MNYCRIDYELAPHSPSLPLFFPPIQRIATVTAIEFCEIYVLDYPSFKKNVQINEAIMQKLTETANVRMRMTLRAEEEHKKRLRERIARETFVD
jgi:CRP-like cAMP-binding protein